MPTPNPWDYADKSGAEHAHQAALFMWANMAARFGYAVANDKRAFTEPGWALSMPAYPVKELKWLHAIHNQGHGDVIRGTKAKAEGVKAGVFDMFLPVPMMHPNGSHSCGLYIEMKVGKKIASNDQLEFQAFAKSMNYQAHIAYGWLEAAKIIVGYLSIY